MGDLPSDSKTSMNQRMRQLERRLKEQQDSHQQQLASFLVVNASLCEESAPLRKLGPTLLRPNNTTHHVDDLLDRRSPMQSESTSIYSPPKRHLLRHGELPLGERTPSPRRNLDPALQALDYISALLFVHAILTQETPPHFVLPKFQKYDGLQDPFDHLMNYRQIMTL